MPYKVWIAIEKDNSEDVGLPDPVAEDLETLHEAQVIVRSVLEIHNPKALEVSDHREEGIVDKG